MALAKKAEGRYQSAAEMREDLAELASGAEQKRRWRNGLTVSKFLGDANTCLGGGSCLYSYAMMDEVALELNGSFDRGTPDAFAQTNLAPPTTSTVPEPSSFIFLVGGCLLVLSRRRQGT
jgi:hypothetical protein